MLKGLLLKESLNDLMVIDGLRITKTEIWQAGNAAPNQPPVWTALSFEADDSQADALAGKLSRAIKPEGWYINASTDTWVYVVFPRKVFKYVRGDAEQRAAAKQYGRSCNIPEKQLDWSE